MGGTGDKLFCRATRLSGRCLWPRCQDPVRIRTAPAHATTTIPPYHHNHSYSVGIQMAISWKKPGATVVFPIVTLESQVIWVSENWIYLSLDALIIYHSNFHDNRCNLFIGAYIL